MRTRILVALAATSLALFAVPQTADAQGATLAFAYELRIAGGSAPAFEAAWKEHMAFREAHNDPWSWSVFQQMFGEDAGTYIVYSSGHTWADLDTYFVGDFADRAQAHLAANVAPLIESFSSAVSMTNAELSVPAENIAAMNVFPVTVFYLEASAQEGFMAALGEYRNAVMEAGLPIRYHVSMPIAGQEGPSVTIVQHSASFGALEIDQAELMSTLTSHMGEDDFQEMFSQLGDAIERTESAIYTLRRDLSSGN